jgi:hypothetical protein
MSSIQLRDCSCQRPSLKPTGEVRSQASFLVIDGFYQALLPWIERSATEMEGHSERDSAISLLSVEAFASASKATS